MKLLPIILLMLLALACGKDNPACPENEVTHADVVFLGQITEQPDDWGNIKLLGLVKNVGEVTAWWVKINATIFDAQRKVIDTDFTYVNGYSMTTPYGFTADSCVPVGRTASFELSTDAPDSIAVSYELLVNWREY